MFPVPLVTSSTILVPATFWDVVLLYHNRPHLVNRKLLAASQILFYKISFTKCVGHVSELFTRASILYEVRKLQKLCKENISQTFLKELLECFDKNVILNEFSINDFKEESKGIFISVRILMPRISGAERCIEIVTLDKDNNTAVFFAASENNTHPIAPPYPYNFELTSAGNLRINLENFEDADTTHAEWLADKLFPKLLKWADSEIDLNNTLGSLSLISLDDYCATYKRLKTKYSDDLMKVWPTKTNTNPQKYIFEDFAIASYLICLWENYEKSSINFVDCGCGNGLLVYILSQEGYKGFGLDIKRRAIWDVYPKSTHLEVGTVTPSTVFPTCTWIIGNHSDELTPWIPVIAMKSSPHTNIFVIPCCPFDFSGQKYARVNTSVSQYSDYFDYIVSIYNMCGFETKTDRLRIPSTRRKCLVGVRKNLREEELNKISIDINKFIESRLSVSKFKARSATEVVKNCTQLNRDIIHKLVYNCVRNLLSEENYIEKDDGNVWNRGGSLHLADLSQKIGKEDLKQLKQQCGGLQTLLRNHKYLFNICQGKVFLRTPPILSENTKKYKEKPCWFLKNHPNGCLHDSETCSYKHDE